MFTRRVGGPRWALRLLPLLAVALAIPLLAQHPTATPSGGHTDHPSHVGAMRVLPLIGLSLWRRPMVTFFPRLTRAQVDALPADLRQAAKAYPENLFFVQAWPPDRPLYVNYSPRAYPPGVLLLALPSAILYHAGLASFTASNRLMIVFFILGWYAATLFWLRARDEDSRDSLERWVLLVAGSSYTLYWAVEGMYDPCFVAVGAGALNALRRNRLGTAMALLGGGAMLHLRAFALLPISLACAKRLQERHWGVTAREASSIALGVALLLVAIAFAFIARPALAALPLINPVALAKWHAPGPWLFGLGVAVLLRWFVRARAYLDALMLLAAFAMLLETRDVRPWHVLTFCPWLLGPLGVDAPDERRTLRLRLASAALLFGVCNAYSLV